MAELRFKKMNGVSAAAASSSSSSKRSSSKSINGFTRKCASLVKEQRARIYILRRCATTLLCWYIHGDD